MNKKSRRKFTPEFKAKVCIEALKERQTVESLSKKYDVHPNQISTWKKEFLSNSAVVFENEGKDNAAEKEELIQRLYAQIGEQKVAIDFLKKNLM
jgi:transposase-like protein